jgi:hypothetical protein
MPWTRAPHEVFLTCLSAVPIIRSMTSSDDIPEDLETEIRQILESLPPDGITQGTSEVRTMTLAAANTVKGRFPQHPILIGDPDDQNVVVVTIGPVPVVTKFES